MISIKNISKKFDKVQALESVTFDIARGELCGLVGANGAGKSTLFNILMGLLEPDRGEVYLDGKRVNFGDFAYKKDVGYAPENPALYEYLSGSDFLNFIAAAKKIPHSTRKTEIHKGISFFKLEDKADELIINYSHGMRRKMSLCAALLGEPKLLLLDEATNGLDPITSYDLKEYLRNFCATGGTIIFSTHIIETLEHLCDRIIILHQGKVLRTMIRDEWQKLADQGTSLEQQFIKLINKSQTGKSTQ